MAGLPQRRKPMFGTDQAFATAERFGAPEGAGLNPFQQALTNQYTGATSQAFDHARSASRERALASGMDYTQPAVGANDNAIEIARAKSIGQIPGQVSMETAPLEFQAANLGLGAGRDLNTMQQQSRQRKAGIAGALTRVGAGIAGSFAKPTSRFGRILGGLSRI